jgi:hypothetical protein
MRKLLSLVLGAFMSTQAQAEDKWGVATAQDNGKPLIYRYILSPPSGVRISDYPDMVAMTWVFDASVRNGLPEPGTNSRMVELEELLEKTLESKKNAYLTISVTGNGRKEWQWYSRDVSETMKLINEVLSGRVAYPIEISRQSDPGWSAYFDIVNAAR